MRLYLMGFLNEISAWWLDIKPKKRIALAVLLSFILGHLIFGVFGLALHEMLVQKLDQRTSMLVFSTIGFLVLIIGSYTLTIVMKYQLELNDKSTKDPLTGLYNTRYQRSRIQELVDSARSQDGFIGACFIDLDKFKDVNDTYGHDSGDAVLKFVGSAILSMIREGHDIAFRVGGDEFLVVLTGHKESDIELPVKRIEDFFSHFVVFSNNRQIIASASVGTVIVSANTENVVRFIKAESDRRMYEKKRS